jgi:L-malate glycosyltransferase
MKTAAALKGRQTDAAKRGMGKLALHQIVVGAGPGDAITDQALMIRSWLRQMGFASEIYAEHIHADLLGNVKPFSAYRARKGEPFVFLHHSIGSSIIDQLISRGQQLVLIYHNVTPPEFFADVDPVWFQRMAQGQRQLEQVRPHTALALADSPYNEAELVGLNFERTGTLPIALDESGYDLPVNEQLLSGLEQGGPWLLFVGRLAPNKKQEDLLKLLYYYRRIRPEARLLLVGDRWLAGYDRWLEDLARALGLGEAVVLTGRVSQTDMVTYYRAAQLYISMSEHEGFGKPLIESMYLGLPILAYGSSGVPSTLAGAGVMFRSKEYEALAELVDILITDVNLRTRIIERQRQRVQLFLASSVQRTLRRYLHELGLVV